MTGAQVSGPVSNSYESLPQPGPVQMGAISVSGAKGSLSPVAVTVAGDTCALTVVPNPTE